jgi:non-ribosomal peptide synthetase component E (peptide arylation enzyme)
MKPVSSSLLNCLNNSLRGANVRAALQRERAHVSRSSSTMLLIRNAHTSGEYVERELIKSHTHPKMSYATTVSEFPLVLSTVRDIIDEQAQKLPNQMIYAFPHQGVNMKIGELKQRVDTMAQNYLELGFHKGDRIAFILPNTHELVVAFLAAAKVGLISVVLNPAYQIVELEYMLKKTNAKGVLIYDSFKTLKHMEVLRKLCPELDSSRPGELASTRLPMLKHVVVLNSPLEAEKKQYNGTW